MTTLGGEEHSRKCSAESFPVAPKSAEFPSKMWTTEDEHRAVQLQTLLVTLHPAFLLAQALR